MTAVQAVGFPNTWETQPLWTRFRRTARKGYPGEQLLSVYRDYGVVERGHTDDNWNFLPDDVSKYQLVEPGDIVVNKMKAWQGSLGVSSLRGVVSPAYFVYAPTGPGHSPKFLNYLLRSQPLIESYQQMSDGVRVNQWDLDPWGFSRLVIPTPPVATQRAIADYLDRETAQIDALIEKQHALIDRLRERRLSLIERVTTQGLHDARLSAEGNSWMGTVPRHWTVGTIRRFASMHSGHTPSRSKPQYWEGCYIPWFTLADVWQLRGGATHLGETGSTISDVGLANSAAELLPAGTVILSRTASVGFAGIMPRPMATSQDFWNWVCGPGLIPEYLVYVFRAMHREFAALRRGSTHQTIYQSAAAGFRIPVPPVSEQREITDHLDRETTKIDILIAKAERFVELARERRSALITAGVTGQIDVSTKVA